MSALAAALPLILLGAGPAAAFERPILYPADLGATSVDVSAYPAEHQRAYREIVLTKCAICHSPARALNAPFLELSTAECDRFRREHPQAVADPAVLDVGPHPFRNYVTRMWKRPPCCNLCPVFSKAEVQAVWHFLVYDAQRRKTGAALESWLAYRTELIRRFAKLQEEERHER